MLFMVDTGCPKRFWTNLWNRSSGTPGEKNNSLRTLWKINDQAYAAPRLYLGNAQLLTGRRVFTIIEGAQNNRSCGGGILGMDCLRHYCINWILLP